MPTAHLHFHGMIQDSQEYGSSDEHMVSRVFFTLEVGGKKFRNLYADVKQTVGAKFEADPLEVSRPHGYDGPFNHGAFSKAVENYYRSLVGSAGRMIRVSGGATNIRMRNNRFTSEAHAEIDVPAGKSE